jgi:hypothetical protein
MEFNLAFKGLMINFVATHFPEAEHISVPVINITNI